MMPPGQKPEKALEIFFSYAQKDERWSKRLETHLSNLRRQGFITEWHRRNISAGEEWASEIDTHLNAADIILLLISPDFMATDYCYSVEMMRALDRHEAGVAQVIPILLRPTDYLGTPFERLQALPRDAKPVTRWQNPDEALLDIARGIREAIEKFSLNRSSVSRIRPNRQQTIAPPLIWNVPYRRNPFFTGREQLLPRLHDKLTSAQNAALTQSQAISGLGGIGKTQIAVEYAYRYRNEYRSVFWIRAATRDSILADFVAVAQLLQLPEIDQQDQMVIVAAVKKWLTECRNWLLILDNADDLKLLDDFLPVDCPGHILLTTRAQATGAIADILEVDKMDVQESTLLLLRRARLLPAHAVLEEAGTRNRLLAEAITKELDGLPLALDQAGAYIEETRCSLSAYLDLYRSHRKDFLTRQSRLRSDHPEPVATTWSLSFQQIEQANPAAAELLCLCAFLDPDTIPEEMIAAGATELGPVLQPIAADAFRLNEALEELRKFSLIKRNSDEKMLSIHRLVQAVLRDDMDRETQQRWVERTVRAVNQAFPGADVQAWPQWQHFIPQAQACALLIEQYHLTFPEAARLLNEAGRYLSEHARYTQAEQLLQQALTIRVQVLGAEHADTGATLYNLGYLYNKLDRDEQAETLYQRALAIQEKTLGSEHADTIMSLLGLAFLYKTQRRDGEAEPLFQKALVISNTLVEQELPDTAAKLNNLALLFLPDMGLFRSAENDYQSFERAESLLVRALSISEKAQGTEDTTSAIILLNLGLLYSGQNLYEQAEASYKKTLEIIQGKAGSSDPRILINLQSLARLYRRQQKYEQVEPLLQRALTIAEQNFERNPLDMAGVLTDLASFYSEQKQFTQAEPLLQRALAIYEQVLGPNHLDTANSLSQLASCYTNLKRYAQADPLLQRALAIHEQVLGPNHPKTASSLLELALFFQLEKQYVMAEPLLQRILTIYEHVLDPNAPTFTVSFFLQATYYERQNRLTEAETFYQRALSVWEKASNREQVIAMLERFIDELPRMGLEEEANELAERVQTMRAKLIP